MLLGTRISKLKADPAQADQVEVLENDEKKNAKLIEHYQSIKDTNSANLNFGIRPEDIAQDNNSQLVINKSEPFDAKISISELLGNEYHVHSEIGDTLFVAKFSANQDVFSDEDIKMVFNMDKIHLFDELSTERIF